MTEVLVAICIVAGVFFMFVAAVGVLRLSDFYARVHAPTKAATLGLIFLLTAVVLVIPDGVVITKALLAVLFIAATAPVGAHILSRAAYRSRVPRDPKTTIDEYAPVMESKQHGVRGGEPVEASDVQVEHHEQR